MSSRFGWGAALLVVLAGCAPRAARDGGARRARPAPARGVRAEVQGLAHIQRTMRLLSESSAERPTPVRVLFYGQSITESAWSAELTQRLRARYPHAALVIENRALGGFAADRLARTVEADVPPFEPDLVILHAYGADDAYEALVSAIRARTSAEILVQSDHVTRDEERDEPLEAAAHPRTAEHWSGFMNHVFLPSLVARHEVALCDVRSAWKAYLAATGLGARELLADAVHLGPRGDALMAELVESCLVRAPALRSPAEAWVEELAPAPRVSFRAQRVVVHLGAGSGSLAVRIDGRPPSALGLALPERAALRSGGKWPPVYGLAPRGPLVAETLTLTLTRRGAGPVYRFRVRGSVTGDQGEGRTDAPFVTRHGALVIEPAHWDLPYVFALLGQAPPAALELALPIAAGALDRIEARPVASAWTVARGLGPDSHTLELTGDAPLVGITLYRSANGQSAP